LGITKIEANPRGGYFEFSQNTKVNPSFIIGLIQSAPHIYKMDGANKLRFATKLFLQHEASAVYCYSEVVAIEKQDNEHYQYTLLFVSIRDSDQELVVRASLHAQTRQLKKRQQLEKAKESTNDKS